MTLFLNIVKFMAVVLADQIHDQDLSEHFY